MKKLRVGVVGVGYLGKFHAEKYAKMENVELVGVVDINDEAAKNIAREYNIIPYNNHKELIGKVDAVSVVVPTPLHFNVSRDFLLNDVSVLIEKPITTTLEEADDLIRISEERGLIIQVGHLERFNPAVVSLQSTIKEPMFIESHRLSVYKERGSDVSVVLDLMIHDIDIILNFVKSEIKTIHAAGVSVVSSHVDIANARLEFKNGCVANITASRISTKNQRKIRLFQKNTYIAVDFANREITTITHSNSGSDSFIPAMENMKISKVNFKKGDALEDELRSFVKAVLLNEACEVTGHAGRDALKIALNVMGQIQKKNRLFSLGK
mmetsp:Transcript_21518/g.9983  ORF Transcript_21518/g.9983 Transcript_21518/m.9983 type:complete len:324 (+) Transcript_21518:9109-10080(+)